MKKSIFFFFSFFALPSENVKPAKIQGSVRTKDGLPAQYIYIAIKETGAGTESNSQGTYEFKSVIPGTYSLVISYLGMQTMEQTVTVKANETAQVPEIRLTESARQLK